MWTDPPLCGSLSLSLSLSLSGAQRGAETRVGAAVEARHSGELRRRDPAARAPIGPAARPGTALPAGVQTGQNRLPVLGA